MELGKLKEIKDLRRVWKHEATDFTPWLADEENLSLLADAIGLELTVEETESSVGSFHVDIYAIENLTGKKVIIENQLEDTNHDHLGKIITYAAGKSASIIIWVVKTAREEHRAAVEWLNNNTDDGIGFFLCEVKLYQIGNSQPAVKFEVVEKPNDWVKENKKEGIANPTQQARYDYWIAFNEYAYNNNEFAKNFNKRKASTDHWMSLSVGSSACHISLSQIRKFNNAIVEWYIPDDKELYHKLLSHKDMIEKEAGLEFEWNELPEKKASRIIAYKDADFDNKGDWNNQFDWMMDVAIRMKKVFVKYI